MGSKACQGKTCDKIVQCMHHQHVTSSKGGGGGCGSSGQRRRRAVFMKAILALRAADADKGAAADGGWEGTEEQGEGEV